MTTNTKEAAVDPKVKRSHLTPQQSVDLVGWLAERYDWLLGKTYAQVANTYWAETGTAVTPANVLNRCVNLGLNTLGNKIIIVTPRKPLSTLAESIAFLGKVTGRVQLGEDEVVMYRAADGELFETKDKRDAYNARNAFADELIKAVEGEGLAFDVEKEQIRSAARYIQKTYNLTPKVAAE